MIFGLNFTFLSKYWFYYMDGLKVTLQLAFWTLILSSIVGVIMGMIRVQNYKIISTLTGGLILSAVFLLWYRYSLCTTGSQRRFHSSGRQLYL